MKRRSEEQIDDTYRWRPWAWSSIRGGCGWMERRTVGNSGAAATLCSSLTSLSLRSLNWRAARSLAGYKWVISCVHAASSRFPRVRIVPRASSLRARLIFPPRGVRRRLGDDFCPPGDDILEWVQADRTTQFKNHSDD
jgi:hypothetical protein